MAHWSKHWMVVVIALFLAGWPAGSSGAGAGEGAVPALEEPEGRSGQWGMFKNTAGRQGRTLALGPQEANLLWVLGDSTSASPVIARDGTVYLATDGGTLTAVRPDGSVRWGYDTGWSITATPAVGLDGTVYVVNERGVVRALAPEDGALLWTYRTWAYAGPAASPAIGSDGTIYVGANALYALRPDGTLKWRFAQMEVRGPPAIRSWDGTLYVPGTHPLGDLVALSKNGSVRWVFNGGWLYHPESAPAIGPDGTIYAVTTKSVLVAISPSGEFKWQFDPEELVVDVPSSPAVGWDGTIYYGSHDHVYAIDPDGTPKWWYETGAMGHTAPSIGRDGMVYIGGNVGAPQLFALQPDGTLQWSYYTGGYVRSAPAIGWGRRVYFGSWTGFYALGP